MVLLVPVTVFAAFLHNVSGVSALWHLICVPRVTPANAKPMTSDKHDKWNTFFADLFYH